MITAIVFVKADVARIPEVAEAIAALEGVSEVYSVTGQIDLITLVRVSDHDDVARVVADSINKVSGVMETETHIAFRTYSQHDLESAFSLGPRLRTSRFGYRYDRPSKSYLKSDKSSANCPLEPLDR